MLLPIVFLLVGLAGGIGASLLLTPSTESTEQTKAEAETEYVQDSKSKTSKEAKNKGSDAYEYLKLTKQFVVPVVADDEITALVTMSLSLETNPGITEVFYDMEPKLRDGFLQVLFDHANTGGFDGAFTTSDNLLTLRRSLLEVARKELGQDVSAVLIMSVSRQDT
ncbi:flagellar basal body-associated protein FliL [Ruegeria sp. ANG-S4]|uniref:flagellar basal body-associated protein FliL n=1 Tax=Ruegeria sp. ANG-S4 TaxID=1577904 RepID=UPI00315AE5D4